MLLLSRAVKTISGQTRLARIRCSSLIRAALVLTVSLVLPAGGAQAMPDDPWCMSVSNSLQQHQVDREGLVRRAAAQHDWPRLRRLFLLDWPFPSELRGSDRARAMHEFRSVQLIVASARDDLRAVTHLLAAGANPNVEGGLDYIATPLALAALCDRPAVAQRLIRGGARVNYRFRYSNDMATHEGTTALMWASMGGSLRVTRILLSHGARADWRESYLMHGEPPRAVGATALEISSSTDSLRAGLSNGCSGQVFDGIDAVIRR